MFGLFDPPPTKIRKRIPVALHNEFDQLHAVVLLHPVLAGLTGPKKEMVAGIALSVWACNNAMARRFDLRDFDYRFIQNLASNCERFLGPDASVIGLVLNQLIEAGLVPAPEKNEL
jgi:hypothetical protein